MHANHLGTPIRGTHGLRDPDGDPDGDPNTGPTDRPGDIVFDDFRSPFGLLPDPGWGGAVVASGYSSTTGTGPNCGVTGFTTHVRDCETGLTYMQARYYSADIARFGSMDPVTFGMTGDPRFFNRYSYSFNDPINLKDPTGMCPICPLGLLALAGGGTVTAGGATVGAGTIAVGAGVTTFGVLVVTDPLDGVFTNDQATPLPDGLVGENPRESRGKRKNSGPLTPENGGTGNAEEDFGVLGGGTSEPAGEGMPEGSEVAPNGTRFRPGTETKGPRIDVPANGDKPHETLHYPDPPPPPPEER